ncbi:hypothetical protein EDB85DRAFT_5963 [Lactarius pseudohatsudake]|nr:hypothetical protein EDB85DRAFT_5963 [Lactarius pseudohatsudake]
MQLLCAFLVSQLNWLLLKQSQPVKEQISCQQLAFCWKQILRHLNDGSRKCLWLGSIEQQELCVEPYVIYLVVLGLFWDLSS